MLGVLILSEKACLLEFSVFLFFIKVKNKAKQKTVVKGEWKTKLPNPLR